MMGDFILYLRFPPFRFSAIFTLVFYVFKLLSKQLDIIKIIKGSNISLSES